MGLVIASGCDDAGRGVAPTEPGDGPTVVWDVDAKPLPELPLPNDFATRPDTTSPTGLRLNASLLATTEFEATIREKLDQVTGWGTSQPFTIRFDKPLDLQSILNGHRDYNNDDGADYDFSDDVVYLIDVTPGSPTFQQPVPLDFGDGNFPDILRRPDLYLEADPKSHTPVLLMETYDEDTNGNGELDPGEDIDMDGLLDKPNTYAPLDGEDGVDPYDDVLTFYERQTNTLTARPVIPLLQATTYAIVVTKRLRGENGSAVKSPFDYVNHVSQTDDIERAVPTLADYDVSRDDIAFAWSFTTQSVHHDLINVRNGMYGAGPLAWINEDFPAELDELYLVREPMTPEGDPVENQYIIPSDILKPIVPVLASALFGGGSLDVMTDTHGYPAYHVQGSFTTPYLLDIEGEERLNGVWPHDLTNPALRDRIGRRTVHFWCAIPRDELKEDPNEPAPVIVNGHGYTLNRLDGLGGYVTNHSKFGFAGCMIEAADHGLEVDDAIGSQIDALFPFLGLTPAGEVLKLGRGRDIDGDGIVDSGDTWFGVDGARIRDSFRQTLVDYMMLIRVLRNFDGERMMPFDVDGDGEDEIAGDFNADGIVDLGGPNQEFFATGVSLGGIMSSQLPAVEPSIVAAAPISGGAALTSLVLKSEQGGVWESFSLQALGPLFVGVRENGGTHIYEIVSDGNDDTRVEIGMFPELNPGDIVVATNLENGEGRCARIIGPDTLDPEQIGPTTQPEKLVDPDYFSKLDGSFRVGVPSDAGDRIALQIVAFDPDEDKVDIDTETLDCHPKRDADIILQIDQFQVEAQYRQQIYPANSPLIAASFGLGLKRANPLLRRLVSLAGVVVEPADPVNFAPYYSKYNEMLTFAEGDQVFEKPDQNVMVYVTAGDPAVPASVGVNIARAAGFFTSFDGEPDAGIFEPDPRYGKTINRVLVDNRVTEAITWLDRFPGYACQLMDIDNPSNSENTAEMDSKGLSNDGFDCPRLDPALRLTVRTFGTEDGVSGLSVPIVEDTGAHVFVAGTHSQTNAFDIGTYGVNQIANYFRSRGTEIVWDTCLEELDGCDFMPKLKKSGNEACEENSECWSGECSGLGKCAFDFP